MILGSQSPRRKELLAASFLPFEIVTSNIEEKSIKNNPSEIAEDLAFQKATAVFNKLKSLKNKMVLGADTIVVFESEVLGKPKTAEEAKLMLKKLSGRSHFVYTGVCLRTKSTQVCFHEKTEVIFREISMDLLDLYVQTGDSLDKAGSYGIQGKGLSFIQEIQGSYSNVVGLPIDRVIVEIKKMLNSQNDNDGEWRKCFE